MEKSCLLKGKETLEGNVDVNVNVGFQPITFRLESQTDYLASHICRSMSRERLGTGRPHGDVGIGT